MNLYKANSSNLRNFTLEKDDKTIGELIYKSWYSFKAEIALNNNQIYYFKPLGYFDPSIELFKEQTKIMSFKLGWKGVIIRVFNNGTETKFLLKKKCGTLDTTLFFTTKKTKKWLTTAQNSIGKKCISIIKLKSLKTLQP